MLKFLIISLVLIYVVARFSGFVFRVLYWITGNPIVQEFKKGHRKQENNSSKSSSQEGDIHVIFDEKEKKRRKNFKGGEYVDYEEINEKED